MIQTIINYQVFWVIGALERLATLGLIERPPLVVSQDTVDSFVLLDEMRDGIFSSNDKIRDIVASLVMSYNMDYDSRVIDDLYFLLTEYKDNRTKIVKYALTYCEC
jgi:hypothetical protein